MRDKPANSNEKPTLKKSNIHDVAKRAGVSIKTVSRVVNHEDNVRPETRERVLQAVEALHFRPDPSARRLAGKRSFLVGLLYDNPSASYVLNVQSGVLNTCREYNYDLLIHPCDITAQNLEQDILSMIEHTHVDGLILTPPLSDYEPLIQLLQKHNIPNARIAPAEPIEDNIDITTNDLEASAEMTRHLIDLGHKRIGFVVGDPLHKAVLMRHQGYLKAHYDSGLAVDYSLIVQGNNSFESGTECARKLIAQKSPPTAIFASNDDMAAGVIKVLHDSGLAIPGDISVAGFDDIPLASQIWPAMTTIRQPIIEMASRATLWLISALSNKTPEVDKHIKSELIIRESTYKRTLAFNPDLPLASHSDRKR